uniref:Uncharacterized protein n=1 Tax=Arundo donax TaxID=35708 RepID=A0A0A9GHX1_ARUDO
MIVQLNETLHQLTMKRERILAQVASKQRSSIESKQASQLTGGHRRGLTGGAAPRVDEQCNMASRAVRPLASTSSATRPRGRARPFASRAPQHGLAGYAAPRSARPLSWRAMQHPDPAGNA